MVSNRSGILTSSLLEVVACQPGLWSCGEYAVDVKQAVVTAIVGQFGHPRGAAGNVAGWVMAHRPSNRQRNRWVASLLDVQPTDRVLEIGFGPGLAIAELSR